MDNLDSFTYEMFEKDPVKYTEYEKVLLKVCTVILSSSLWPGPLLTLLISLKHVSCNHKYWQVLHFAVCSEMLKIEIGEH